MFLNHAPTVTDCSGDRAPPNQIERHQVNRACKMGCSNTFPDRGIFTDWAVHSVDVFEFARGWAAAVPRRGRRCPPAAFAMAGHEMADVDESAASSLSAAPRRHACKGLPAPLRSLNILR